ncbi:outer membrane beta-barrel protein [Chryseobacterium rhizosphaerae]|jgi:hypothetical protein|uniref:outer membrane beta-barrel protein n=1 Tax=Chryseobacterium rhizosphaerae TaxID=395937 RepID=UPI00064670AC|nr:outer membrane beta-barrel protein [Chryseobacterium rhizosphaerae]MDC8101480.1 porin family protein [Chryseobacterium rhizosphaerae]MDR6544115.1 hypothetical protein [Chryseobacterium rhizosphaerae]
MKKILVMTAIAVFGMVSAQKNSLLVGGNIGYSNNNNKFMGDKVSSTEAFTFTPTVGYQFHKNWTIGINSVITSGKQEEVFNNNPATLKTNEFAIGPFVRYAVPLGDIFAVYGDLGAGYQNQNMKTTTLGSTSEVKSNGFYTSFTPALFINFKNGFGLNFNIGGIKYSHLKADGIDATSSNFNLSFGKEVGVGISKNFGLK